MVNWFQPPLQSKYKFKAGDTIVAVPSKSGTTWTMNIFHQLRTGGDADFKDIYAEIAWVEFKERPDQTDEELFERWDKMPAPQAFKSHNQPGDGPGDFLPYLEDMKYIVVMRNPEEALVSFYPFLAANNPKFFEAWGLDYNIYQLSTFQEFYDEMVMKGFPGMPAEIIPPAGSSPCSTSASSTAGGPSATSPTCSCCTTTI